MLAFYSCFIQFQSKPIDQFGKKQARKGFRPISASEVLLVISKIAIFFQFQIQLNIKISKLAEL